MDEQRQEDQLEPTYNCSVPIQDVALKTYQRQWTIVKGGKRGSGISVQMVRHNDDISHTHTHTHGRGSESQFFSMAFSITFQCFVIGTFNDIDKLISN